MDKYEDFELVGEGSFGRVFKGRPKNGPAGHFVALKLLPKVGQSESELHNLRRECKIQRTLDHDNIVKAAESFETVNELVLVTEFVDGGNLATLMSQYQNGLPVYTVKQITVDLMCALHYLHGMRVLHRDLKPQNVLIDKASGKAKLADFGFARNLGINTLVLTSIKGTPLYMAPELIEERPYDFKADLWSAGGILYEVATGKPPFATNSLFQLIKKIRYEQVSWPGGIKDSICVGFLQGLLEKDVKKRMNWQQILSHRYISELPRIMECAKLTTEFTKPLTESQELAKEIQRQDKAKKLPGGSQTLINIAQKYEEQKKKLEQMKFMSPQPFGHFKGRRYSDLPHYQQLLKPEVSRPQRR
jgi:fused-like protein